MNMKLTVGKMIEAVGRLIVYLVHFHLHTILGLNINTNIDNK